jgi:hypothetical protein
MLWVILAHAALIELALIVLGTKPSDKGGGVEIHLSGKITPSDRPPQLTVATGSVGWLIVRVEVRLATERGVSVGNERGGEFAPLNCLRDLLDRVKGLPAKTTTQVMAQSPRVASEGQISLDVANHEKSEIATSERLQQFELLRIEMLPTLNVRPLHFVSGTRGPRVFGGG